jgi:hypothetical protein
LGSNPPRPLGKFPGCISIQFVAPCGNGYFPQGAAFLHEITHNQGHDEACHNCGKDVHKELSHGFILLSENSPRRLFMLKSVLFQ